MARVALKLNPPYHERSRPIDDIGGAFFMGENTMLSFDRFDIATAYAHFCQLSAPRHLTPDQRRKLHRYQFHKAAQLDRLRFSFGQMGTPQLHRMNCNEKSIYMGLVNHWMDKKTLPD